MRSKTRTENNASQSELNKLFQKTRSQMLELLQGSIAHASISGHEKEFVEFINNCARQNGFETDLWHSSETDIAGFRRALQPHIPLAGRPTLVIRLPGKGTGKSLIFNAHSDVVPPGEIRNWLTKPWGGQYIDGKIYGRGACDAKGPLIGALWAMLVIKLLDGGLPGDIMLELVPGEENCVGIGTLTSIARGYRGDAAVVLEPTENEPRCASRPGIRFEIVCHGKAAHGTTKWLGNDAIVNVRKILDCLDTLEQKWNVSTQDELFSEFPIARPVTVDSIQGGQWRGLICEACRCEGYIELLPDDKPEEYKNLFRDYIAENLPNCEIDINFTEEYPGYRISKENLLCKSAEFSLKLLKKTQYKRKQWRAFNSGCEAGIRAEFFGTPTLVWGPGSIAQAHAADEFILFDDVEFFAKTVVTFLRTWTK